jgi:tyrosinase
MFILGMRALEGMDEKDLTSYYQISGIHGLPFKPWDGVKGNTDWSTTSQFGGYCTHSSVLFTTWHRPYLALFEVGHIHSSLSVQT